MKCANCHSTDIELIEVTQQRKRFKIDNVNMVVKRSEIMEDKKIKRYIYCNYCKEKFSFKKLKDGTIKIDSVIK